VLHPSRCSQIITVVSLGLSLMCATTRAQQFSPPTTSPPTNISSNSDSSVTPQVAGDAAGNIYAVWEDDTASNSNILFSRSTDGGVTFSTPPQNLSNSTGYSFSPRIAVDAGGGINVVWVDTTPLHRTVFFSRSVDGGKTFSSPPTSVSDGRADSGNPEVAVDAGGNISVVWENEDIIFGVFYAHSTDGGTSFSTQVNLATEANLETNYTGSFNPQLALDASGNLYVAWEDDFNSQSDIFFRSISNQGATLSTPTNLSNSGSSSGAQLAMDSSGNVNVVWVDGTSKVSNILFRRSADKGVSFSSPKNLSNSLGKASYAQISVDAGGNVYVVWQGTVPPSLSGDIFFARSADGGATFATLNLANSFGGTPLPWLTADAAGNINVSWTDTNLGNPQIFFKQSIDGGVMFSTTQNLSNDAGLGFASEVQMAADSKGNLNVVWSDTDDATGVNQIFFRRSFSNPKKANQPPVANAGPDQKVECTGHGCALVTLDGSKSSGPDGDTLSFVWQDESNKQVGTSAVTQLAVPMGTHTFTLTVAYAGGLPSTAVTHVTVRDTTPPTLQVSLSPNVIRSREQKRVRVNATVKVSDVCDPNPKVKLVSITSNDPDDRGRRRVSDVQAVGGGSFLLRAEDSERGKDIVYTITYSATDASGNTTTATAQVRVARHGASHDRSRDDDDKDNKRDNKEHNRSGH
jgi:hypothetical protein